MSGYLTRLSGASGRAAELWSMDAPLSLPRMFVAALFGAAGVVAIAAAARLPERRAWWTAVGLVAASIAVVKAGSSVHSAVFHELRDATSLGGAVAVSVLAAGGVLGALWLLSRSERRDRLRVLTALAIYAGASVGLSGVSSAVAGSYGGSSRLAAGATFLEETGEALRRRRLPDRRPRRRGATPGAARRMAAAPYGRRAHPRGRRAAGRPRGRTRGPALTPPLCGEGP